MISETHFTKKSYFKIAGYNVYYTNHPDGTAHGGTAVLIKSKIKHHEVDKYQKDNIQATNIVIEDWNGPFIISAVYCPPKFTNKEEQYSHFFTTLGTRFLAGGDYNAKHQHWGSRLATPKGRELYKTMTNMKLDVISTGEPTYWPTDRRKIPDVIDFCIIKGFSKLYFKAESCLELSSDHSPVVVTMCSKIIEIEKPPSLCNKKTNWNLFRSLVTESINLSLPLKTESEISDAVEHFNHCVQQAAWNSTPSNSRKAKPSRCSTAALELISKKRRLRKQWQTTRSPELKNKLNQIVKKLRTTLRREKEQSISTYLEGLSPTDTTDYSLWKATKKMKQPQQPIPPIRSSSGQWAKTNKAKADLFAHHLETVFVENEREVPAAEEEHIHLTLNATHQLELPIKKFTYSDVKSVIKRDLNPKKAPGYDLITGQVLKELPEKGFKFLTQLFNSILRTSYFPLQWKVATIIMILKPGKKPEEVQSYRPISLLPIPSKVFEKLLYKRLQPIIDREKLIPDHQFGFRQKHSTIEQISTSTGQ